MSQPDEPDEPDGPDLAEVGAVRLPGGKIRAPAVFTATNDDGGEVIGEAVLDLEPGDPGYAAWDEWLTSQGQPPA
jgi:hypothetical protein